MKTRRRTKRRMLGMQMVEMVFVLPLLLLLVFAIAEFGLMFSRWLTLSNAVREGARVGVNFRGVGCDPTATENQVKAAVVSYARAGGLPLTTGDVTVGGTGGVCGASGTNLKVDGTYPFPLNIPFARINSTNSVTLKYSSTMRNE